MLQRFDSLYELKSILSLENFAILPEKSNNKCVYCGLDLFEILYEDGYCSYVRCNLCNTFWIITSNSVDYVK